MNYELHTPQDTPKRNAKNGRFLKGFTPHNKGKKWSEWMDMRKAKRVLRIAKGNLRPRYDIGGWNATPVFAIDKDGNTVGWFASAEDAQRKTGINSSCICKVTRGQRKTAGGYKWVRDTKRKNKM